MNLMTIAELKALGVDTEQGLARCMNNESFYLRLVGMAVQDANFEKLFSSVESGDLEGAFAAAHALKGTTGNLALTPIYAPVNGMTDLLRARTQTDYTEGLKAVLEARDRLQAICGE